MIVVGNADHDAVQGFLRLQQFSIITVALRGGKPGPGALEVGFVHIAKRDHVDRLDAGDLVDIVAAAPGDADEGEVQLVIGGRRATFTGRPGSGNQSRGDRERRDGFG
jgi:hypothetical protein